MSDYATCGLVLVCIAMTGGAGIAVCILRGCGGWCWLTCGLQLLAGPVMVLGTGATIYSTVDGAQPATNGTSTISDSQFRSLVVKVGVWYYLAIACYLGSVGRQSLRRPHPSHRFALSSEVVWGSKRSGCGQEKRAEEEEGAEGLGGEGTP
ncbi:hypothetical protein JCM10213_001710 [Rhodosporidiobolus nylandii]